MVNKHVWGTLKDRYSHWMQMPPNPPSQEKGVRDYTKPITFYSIDNPDVIYVTKPTFSQTVEITWETDGISKGFRIPGQVSYIIETCEHMFSNGVWIQIANKEADNVATIQIYASRFRENIWV